MSHKPLLMVPGPTPCPPAVLRAMSRPMISHRGPEYQALQAEVCAGLRQAFHTDNEVLVFPASGTGGLEAAIVNVLSPGDGVLGVAVGAFGERFLEIAAAFGAAVTPLRKPWGQAASPDEIAAVVRDNPELRAILVTHNETSTGVLQDVQGIAAAVRAERDDVLILVDSVSGMLTAEMQPDEWDIDIVVAGSQKAWMTPPGLTMLSVSRRAMEAHAEATMPRFYFDFSRMLASMDKDQTPYTPAVSQLYALREALRMILDKGVEASVDRHARMAAATRAGLCALKLQLLAQPDCYSNSVTAVRCPQGIDADALQQTMRLDYGVEIAGGQGALRGEVFRIGHLGYIADGDILACMGALERALSGLGHRAVSPEVAVAAAQATLAA